MTHILNRPIHHVMLLICVSGSTYTTLPRTTRGQPIVLGGDPKGKNFLYTNGNSVIIRDIAVSTTLQALIFLFFIRGKAEATLPISKWGGGNRCV